MKLNLKNIPLIALLGIALPGVTLLGITLLGITSCTDEHPNQEPEQGQTITFTAGSSPQLRGGAPLGAEGLSTREAPRSRAAGITWNVADRVGIYMLSHDASGTKTWVQRLAAAAGNALYITDNSIAATSVGLIPGDGTTILRYPVDRSAVNFVAYSPYLAAVNDDTNLHTYPVNVSTSTGTPQVLENVDLLYTANLDEETEKPIAYTNQSAAVALAFEHQLAKLTISVTSPSPGPGPEAGHPGFDDDPSLVISGMATTATFDLATGALSKLGGTDNTITAVLNAATNTATYAAWEAIIIPQAGESPETETAPAPAPGFEFSFGGTVYRFELPAGRVFEPGKSYSYALKLIDKELVLIKNVIDNWSESEPIDMNAEPLVELSQESFALTGMGSAGATPFAVTLTPDQGEEVSSVNMEVDTSLDPSVITGQKPAWLQSVTLSAQTRSTSNRTLTFDALPNTTGEVRKAYIMVKTKIVYTTTGEELLVREVEQMKTIEIAQEPQPESNCYVVASGGTFYIPVGRANRAFPGSIGENTVFTAEELWNDRDNVKGSLLLETVEPYGVGSSGGIKVKVLAGKSGNAVVAVKVNGVIKWSWHIWVLASGSSISPNGNGWMNRNLGATSEYKSHTYLGLHYQWGRKDPWPGSRDHRKVIKPSSSWWPASYDTTTEDLLVKSIENPTVRYPNWKGSDGDESWGASGGKTIYDPCPVGYRVPANSEYTTSGWESFSDSGYGRYNGSYGGFYPASGSWYGNNTLGSTGGTGFYWTRTKSADTTANAFYIKSGDTGKKVYGRSEHFTIRCKKE